MCALPISPSITSNFDRLKYRGSMGRPPRSGRDPLISMISSMAETASIFAYEYLRFFANFRLFFAMPLNLLSR